MRPKAHRTLSSITAGFVALLVYVVLAAPTAKAADPPNVPQTPAAAAISTSSIIVSWTPPIGGANHYHVRSSKDDYSGIIYNNSLPFFTDSFLNVNTGYTYHIYAVNVDGDESLAFAAISRYTLIPAPTGLIFGVVTPNEIGVAADGLLPNLTSGYSGVLLKNETVPADSGWTGDVAWISSPLLPGTQYEFKGRARNGDGILTAETALFARQTLPDPGLLPVAAITSPTNDQIVSEQLNMIGTASDALFLNYIIDYGLGVSPSSWEIYGAAHTTPVTAGLLTTVNTLLLGNGTYTIRLTVFDQALNQSSTAVTIVVENAPLTGTPHGNYITDTDKCALCHGTHTAIASPGILRFGALKYQSQLCYSCHNGSGSMYNIAVAFDTNPSHHPIKDITYDGDPAHTLDCSDCHDAHGAEEKNGQPYPKLLRATDIHGTRIYEGNAFCYACHGENGKIKDMRFFETGNAHNNTDPGQTSQFPNPGSGTMVKCSKCHASHGSLDRRLGLASDRVLCGSCHPDPPYTLRIDNEVVTSLGYPGAWVEPTYAGIRVFSQDTFNTPPVGLKGPREYRIPPQSFVPVDIGLAIGDANNDGKADVVQTVGFATNLLAVFQQDSNGYGIKNPVLFSGKGGYGVAIGDVMGTGFLNEVVIAGDSAANNIKVVTILGGTIIDSVDIASGGTGLRGVAIGDVDSDGDNDVVVTNFNSRSISVFKQATGVLALDQTVDSGGLRPRDVVIGDVNNDGKNEVVVANVNYSNIDPAPYPNDNIVVFSQNGGALALSVTFNNGQATAGLDLAIGDVLSGYDGNEIVCVGHQMYPPSSAQGDVTVINIPSASLSTVSTGALDSKSVATGDIDGNGSTDVAVLNATSISIFTNSYSSLPAPVVYQMRGPNTAGLSYETGVIDIGNIGNLHPYGHRTEVVGNSCSGACHDPHAVTKAAPTGAVSGTEPVYGSPTTYTTVPNVLKEYQLCYKCHSAAASPMVGTRNIAEELNPNNPSYHSVMAAGKRSDIPPESFVAPWTQGSLLACKDCHDQAASGQQLLHGSVNAYMLKRPYAGERTSNSLLLCYICHSPDFYYPATYTYPPTYTWSRDTSRGGHGVHTRRGFGCPMCHEVHGSSLNNGMIRREMNIRPGPGPGTFICSSDCHKS